jgi:hypothetical protein
MRHFFAPIETDMAITPFGSVITEFFGEHLLCSRNFVLIMINISKAFRLVIIKKEVTKKI